jgi:SAM-dependent methyltransferase
MDAFDQQYYDKDYFETGSKKLLDRLTGEVKTWGYKGTDWSGHYFVVKAVMDMFDGNIGSVLDVGAGQGSFTDYAIRYGLVARGYDFSKWAVEHPLHYAKDNLFLGDATKLPEPDLSYDLVYCSDMVEHIRRTQIDLVMDEFYRISKKWVFIQNPVANNPNEIFDAEKDCGLQPPHHLEAHLMISGHLNMSMRSWWDDLFIKHGFKIRNDLVVKFRGLVPREVVTNWFNIVILEK